MRFAILLSLVAFASFGQGRFDRFNQRTDQGRSHRGFEQSSGAYFEFAPASGAGMGTACACAAITGAKGEALTFTRTGNATCSKQGLATTGILNGDLVVCAGDQPRVESSGGVLGLRVEGARTNETLRSQEINNVVWATTAAGVAAPTITADFAAAPDGTTTADRMQIPACPTAGVDASGANQTSATIASPSSSSVYLKANAGTPSVSVCMFGLATGTRSCTQFALNTSTWTRAEVPNVTNTGGMNMEIACENRTGSYSGATNTGAADILVWGAQSEAGAYATSYIPTVAAAVTRNAEAPSFSVGTGPWGCESASFSVAGYAAAGSNQRVLTLAVGGDRYDQYVNFSGASLQHFTFLSAVTRQHATSNAPAAAGSTSRVLYRQNGTTLVTELDGTTTTSTPSAYTPLNGATTLHVGKYTGGGFELNGIVSRLQLDPTFSRCTP